MTEYFKSECLKCSKALADTPADAETYGRVLSNWYNLILIHQSLEDMEYEVSLGKVESPIPDGVIPFPTPEVEEETLPDASLIPELEPDEEVTFSNASPEAEDEPEEATEPTKKYTAAEVRSALVEARREKGFNVNEYLQKKFGVNSFTALPEGKYAELMQDIEAL